MLACAAWILITLTGGAHADVGAEVAASCAACHGTDGRSQGAIPPLAGRDAKEIARAMREFRNGARPATIMQQISRGYTDAEIDAAAAYFAAQKTP